MSIINLITRYLFWHYTKAFLDFAMIWRDIFWFCVHFFSIPTMFRTLVSPWKRILENNTEHNIVGFFSSLLINIIMRIIGFIVRLVLILIGALSLIVVFVFGLAGLVLWIFTPIILFYIFVEGFILLFN